MNSRGPSIVGRIFLLFFLHATRAQPSPPPPGWDPSASDYAVMVDVGDSIPPGFDNSRVKPFFDGDYQYTSFQTGDRQRSWTWRQVEGQPVMIDGVAYHGMLQATETTDVGQVSIMAVPADDSRGGSRLVCSGTPNGRDDPDPAASLTWICYPNWPHKEYSPRSKWSISISRPLWQCDEELCTWGHNQDYVSDPSGQIPPNLVRRSDMYEIAVKVDKTWETPWRRLFTYMSIPRSGNGKIRHPMDRPDMGPYGDEGDGVDDLETAGLKQTMAWTQFEYTVDVDVKISRRDGKSLGPTSNVIIRPSTIPYSLDAADGSIVIHIPADPNGRRFSVEFIDDLYTMYSDGRSYVTRNNPNACEVGTEPVHALIIFASPFIPPQYIPDPNAPDTHVMKPGPINNGDWGDKRVLYFPAGIYYMNQDRGGASGQYGQSHMVLHPNTRWVHLDRGAYVKGGIEWTNPVGDFYATGHGVLSGEMYVYQANTEEGYINKKSDGDSLHMWWHKHLGGQGQTWYCVGPTLVAPPFNTMDFLGSDRISGTISDYKQVGAYFWQTDGVQNYQGTVQKHVFYHSNDDVIKLYHSDVYISDIVIWKGNNGPIIQMGWDIRDVRNVFLDNIQVIHSRYIWDDGPSALLGGAGFYSADHRPVQPSWLMSVVVNNMGCEGPCPSLIRIDPLESYDMVLRNIEYRDSIIANRLGQSNIPKAENDQIRMNIYIIDWAVAGQKVSMENFQPDRLGRFNVDSSYWGQWHIYSAREPFELDKNHKNALRDSIVDLQGMSTGSTWRSAIEKGALTGRRRLYSMEIGGPATTSIKVWATWSTVPRGSYPASCKVCQGYLKSFIKCATAGGYYDGKTSNWTTHTACVGQWLPKLELCPYGEVGAISISHTDGGKGDAGAVYASALGSCKKLSNYYSVISASKGLTCTLKRGMSERAVSSGDLWQAYNPCTVDVSPQSSALAMMCWLDPNSAELKHNAKQDGQLDLLVAYPYTVGYFIYDSCPATTSYRK